MSHIFQGMQLLFAVGLNWSQGWCIEPQSWDNSFWSYQLYQGPRLLDVLLTSPVSSFPVNSTLWHLHDLNETKLVDDVIDEVRELVSSKSFVICLLDSVRCYSQSVAQNVLEIVQRQPNTNQEGESNSAQEKSIPFPKCISLANRLSKIILEKDGGNIEVRWAFNGLVLHMLETASVLGMKTSCTGMHSVKQRVSFLTQI